MSPASMLFQAELPEQAGFFGAPLSAPNAAASGPTTDGQPQDVGSLFGALLQELFGGVTPLSTAPASTQPLPVPTENDTPAGGQPLPKGTKKAAPAEPARQKGDNSPVQLFAVQLNVPALPQEALRLKSVHHEHTAFRPGIDQPEIPEIPEAPAGILLPKAAVDITIQDPLRLSEVAAGGKDSSKPVPTEAANPLVAEARADRSIDERVMPAANRPEPIRPEAGRRKPASPESGGETPSNQISTGGTPASHLLAHRETTTPHETSRILPREPITAPRPAELAQEPPKASGPIRSVSIDFTPDGAQDVRLRLSERSGDVHVTLHSADAGLSGRLNEGVGELVQSLASAGYDAQAWTPDQGREHQRQRRIYDYNQPGNSRRGSGDDDYATIAGVGSEQSAGK